MKALSLWQPYASLIAVGAKSYETRSWYTPYRGLILICASGRSITRDEAIDIDDRFFRTAFDSDLGRSMGFKADARNFGLPLGAVVCSAILSKCVSTNEFQPDNIERLWGNYDEDRFAWRLDAVRPFATPIPIKGQLGIFDAPSEVVAEAVRQIEEPVRA